MVRPTLRHVRGPVTLALTLVVLVVIVVGVRAAIVWTSESTLQTTVLEAPVQFVEGVGTSNHRYVHQLTISENGTSFTASLSARAGADVHAKDVLRVTNGATIAKDVTLTGSAVTNPNVEQFRWAVRDGETVMGHVDHLALDRSLTFTLPASTTYQMDLDVDTADGSGRRNTDVSFSLDLEATP